MLRFPSFPSETTKLVMFGKKGMLLMSYESEELALLWDSRCLWSTLTARKHPTSCARESAR